MATLSQGYLELLTREWRAQPDDTVGGWCVTLDEDPRSPGDGALAIAMFLSREVAVHIADAHNRSLVDDAARGDAVEPAGAPTLPDQARSGTSSPPGR